MCAIRLTLGAVATAKDPVVSLVGSTTALVAVESELVTQAGCVVRDVAVDQGDLWVACGLDGAVPGTVPAAANTQVDLDPPWAAGNAAAVALRGGYAYIATPHGALTIFQQNTREPLSPEVGPEQGDGPAAIALWNQYALLAFVEQGQGVVRAVDVRDPHAPQHCVAASAGVVLEDVPLALVVVGDTAYVALGATGLAPIAVTRQP
jgi:hypothetical protein